MTETFDKDGYDKDGWHRNDRMAKAVNYTAMARKESLAEATFHVIYRMATTGETIDAQIARMRPLTPDGKREP